jgi:hypothetical protein
VERGDEMTSKFNMLFPSFPLTRDRNLQASGKKEDIFPNKVDFTSVVHLISKAYIFKKNLLRKKLIQPW